jgi:hypothetical protein
MARQTKEGEGWRIGWDSDAREFCGLVGGENWAIELTDAELTDFCQLLLQLKTALSQIAQELMEAERICCEVESHLIWLEAEGYPHAYSLRLIVLTGRRGEGFWAAHAVPGLIQATQSLKVF